MTGSENIVTLRHVDKAYRIGKESIPVLKNVNLSVGRGEYLLDGTDVTACSDAGLTTLRNQKIGFIFQKYHLIPQYTILQNVLLPLLVQGKSRKEAMEEAEKYIKMVGLTDRIDHKPNELSGGQQQRVAIARALVTGPSLLLADEPTGALDSATGKEILALFQKLNDMGNTIIMITHDLNVAKQSRRTVFLKDGILTTL